MATTAEIDWPAELERLAREAEPAALARADEVFAEAAAEHERQTAGYRFECRRWGDYLSIFVEREANQKDFWGSIERKVSTSLNIGQTTDIRLSLGHCFDRRGSLPYHANMQSDDGRSGTGWGTGAGRSAPWKGHHYTVERNYPGIPIARPLVRVDAKSSDRGGMYSSMDDYQPRHVTEGYPRAAKDDEIRFNGIGMTLYAPAGKGQAVYDAILAEIANGYEAPAIATATRSAET